MQPESSMTGFAGVCGWEEFREWTGSGGTLPVMGAEGQYAARALSVSYTMIQKQTLEYDTIRLELSTERKQTNRMEKF